MGLPRRLAALAALMAILLVLGATDLASRWSETTRLEDYRLETVELAHTLADDLARVRPAGEPAAIARGLTAWSKDRIEEAHARAFLFPKGAPVFAGASDDSFAHVPSTVANAALAGGRTQILHEKGRAPGWRAFVPFHSGDTPAVLEVFVSTRRLAGWGQAERRRAFALAVGSAALLASGVYALVGHWVGRPLGVLVGAIESGRTSASASQAPPAPVVGSAEFRGLARAYNHLGDALAGRERESEARANLLALEERARGFERVALLEQTADEFAHEIGTPLHTMSGHLQLLRDDLAAVGNTPAVERVGLVLSQVERVSDVMRHGLDRGSWPPPKSDALQLAAIADRVARFLEPTAAAAGITIALAPPPGAPVLAIGDARFVEHILLNLLKNALEAMHELGRVEIRVARIEGRAALDVEDEGPGIAPEAQARLFEPYVTSKGEHGTGLGLVVSRRLAQAQGGTLELIESTRGAHWRLSLPLAEAVS
jgi:signal transduction histidine kinase